METISEAVVAEVRTSTKEAYPGFHPVDALLAVDSVEDALFTEGVTPEAIPTGRGLPTTPEELQQRLLAAKETGDAGEALFASWLVQAGHDDTEFEWVSRTYARASYDFIVSTPRWLGDGEQVVVDVKSTRGPFERDIHLSIAEIRYAAKNPRYRIARISGIGTSSLEIAILGNVHDLAARIVASLSNLPDSVEAESVRVGVELLEVELRTELQPN